MTIVEDIALIASALFAGAAVYISFAEHPARMTLPPEYALRQWKPAYHKGLQMQVVLLAIGSLAGGLASAQNNDSNWLLGAMLLFANLPVTLGVIMKVNAALEATAPEEAGPATMTLLARWGELHLIRSALGVASMLSYVWALA